MPGCGQKYTRFRFPDEYDPLETFEAYLFRIWTQLLPDLQKVMDEIESKHPGIEFEPHFDVFGKSFSSILDAEDFWRGRMRLLIDRN
jgi:hypothetical protein